MLTDTEEKVLNEFEDVIDHEVSMLFSHRDEIDPAELARALIDRLREVGIMLVGGIAVGEPRS